MTMLEEARFYRSLGLSVIPTVGKSPPRGFPLKEYTRRLPTDAELVDWFKTRRLQAISGGVLWNIAIVCGLVSGVVALDADSHEVAEHVARTFPHTEMMTRTGGDEGKMHFLYRIKPDQEVSPRVRISGMSLDLRGEASYVVSAPSVHPATGRQYERLGSWNISGVPYFEASWSDTVAGGRKRIPDRLAGDEVDVLTRIARARSYLGKLEPAVSGQGGHNRTMYAAACLVQKFGLTIEQAWPLLLEFNDTKCFPKWTARELLHKLESAVQALVSKGQIP